MNFIDLFSGAGGLSEGFIRNGFEPIAHVEVDKAACNTLLTRTAYHYLMKIGRMEEYICYLKREISRDELYSLLPDKLKKAVINKPIGEKQNQEIFNQIDNLKGNQNIDLIIGGPPCQAYSLVGRGKDINGMLGDKRNHLYIEYAKFLEKFKPKFFVFENVLGLFSAKDATGEKYLDKMLELFREVGYQTEYKLLNAYDFGVLQNRKRVILIGKKGTDKGFYPNFKKKKIEVNVSEIFKGLPILKAGEGNFYISKYTVFNSKYLINSKIINEIDFTTQHIARPHNKQDKEIYRIAVKKWLKESKRLNYNDLPSRLQTHKNKSAFTDRFKVVAEDLATCHTVVAHISKDGHYYIHPDIKQNRSITPREAARIQSFSDDYFFEGVSLKPSRTAAFKQIGNAVPPLLAEGIAIEIKKMILQI